MDLPILRSSLPITDMRDTRRWRYEHYILGPSSWAGRYRCFTPDKSSVVQVLPDGQVLLTDPAHDGGYEAARLDGSRLAYDYEELEVAPVVFDVVRMADPNSSEGAA